jgi:hypothetical protein
MNSTIKTFLKFIDTETANEILIKTVIEGLTATLTKFEDLADGELNWHDGDYDASKLLEEILEELSGEKPDMLKVIKLASIIRVRNELYGLNN